MKKNELRMKIDAITVLNDYVVKIADFCLVVSVGFKVIHWGKE